MREFADDEDMDDLCASIRRVGVVQPVVVRKAGDSFLLVVGHRRLAAAKIVGLDEIPCVIRVEDESSDSEIAFAENMFRKDMSAVETATALKDVLEAERVSIEELARGVHRSAEWVRRMVSLCEWPSDVLLGVHQGWLSVSAGANLALVTDEAYRGFLLQQAEDNGVTARVTAAWLQGWRAMLPANQAIEVPPVDGVNRAAPLIPQLPCLCCGVVMRMDALSHVPVCAQCVVVLRDIRVGGG